LLIKEVKDLLVYIVIRTKMNNTNLLSYDKLYMSSNLNMRIYNLNFKTHRKRLRKYLLEGGDRDTFRNLLRQSNLVFNYRTGRFLEYGASSIRQSGQPRNRTRGTLRDGVLYERNYWTELDDLFNQVLDNENYEVNIDYGAYPISPSEIFQIMGNRFMGNRIIATFGGRGYTISNFSFERLRSAYVDGDFSQLTGSDEAFLNALEQGTIITFLNLGGGNVIDDPGFFPYYLKKNFDLSLYGIFNDKNNADYRDNCLIRALKFSNKVDKDLMNEVLESRFIKTRRIPLCKLPEICAKLEISLTITKYLPEKEGQAKHSKTITYGDGEINIKIAVVENHFFLKEKTKYTLYAINNFDDIKHLTNWNYIVGKYDGKYKRDKSKCKCSYELIKELVRNKEKFLEKINIDDRSIISPFYEDIKNKHFHSLDYDQDSLEETPEYKPKSAKYKVPLSNVFFGDFEAGFCKQSYHHEYLSSLRRYTKYTKNENILNPKNTWCFYKRGKITSAQQMLNKIINFKLKGDKIVYFHNLKYDYQFLVKVYGLIPQMVIAPNGREIYVKCKYKNQTIIFKDTACMITDSLGNFGNMFGLEQKKEVMPYEIYTLENIKKHFIEIEEIKKCKDFEEFTCDTKRKKYVMKKFNTEKWNQFLENAKKWKCINGTKINIIKYSKIYCIMDTKVLNDGFDIFRNWIVELTGIDIIDQITISGVADKYCIKEGCYDGVYQLSGVPRIFIQRCLVGGKTMTNRNKAHIDFVDILNRDLDINSSYSFAQVRMKGILKGKPKVIPDNWKFKDIKDKDGYFVKINIKSIKNLDFPLLSYKNEQGIRCWSNDINDLNHHGVYIGKFALEDAIHFGDMDFEIEQGYYFDEGRNPQLPITTNYLYSERKKLKANGNRAEQIYKLILNSVFGRTAIKAFDSELIIKSTQKHIGKAKTFEDVKKYYYSKKKKVFNEKLYLQDLGFMEIYNGHCYINEAKKFVRRQYNNIKEWTERGKFWFIKKNYNVGEHQNRCHVAVEILDLSKRTLNEVLCLADNNNIKVGIIDTDSVQLAKKDVPIITKLFEEQHGKNPNYYLHKTFFGKKLGQWDDDFKLSKSKKLSEIIGVKNTDKSDIDSIGAIYLGKKMYCHHLKSADGNEGFHIRMKGVPTRSIYYYCYENNCNPFDIYKNLYYGVKIKFDLTCGGYFKKFEYDTGKQQCKFNNVFTREISLYKDTRNLYKNVLKEITK